MDQILSYRSKDSHDLVIVQSSVTPSIKINEKHRDVFVSNLTGIICCKLVVRLVGIAVIKYPLGLYLLRVSRGLMYGRKVNIAFRTL